MRVAVLGMGRMGRAMAERLLHTGYEVTVWNRTAERAAPLAGLGARVVVRVADALRDADAVIAVLSDDAAVQQVTAQMLPSLHGSVPFINCSTISARLTEQLAEQYQPFVAAPILGGPRQLASGAAQLFVGGPFDLVERLGPLWAALSAKHVNCGSAVNAATLKLLSNLLLIGGVALMAEAVSTGQANGISNELLRQVFAESYVIGPAVRNRLEGVLTDNHEGWFSVSLADKDLGLAMELAAHAGLDLRTAAGAREELRAAEAAGYGQQDLAAIVEGVRP